MQVRGKWTNLCAEEYIFVRLGGGGGSGWPDDASELTVWPGQSVVILVRVSKESKFM
jgi:hypothetical protein